VKLFNTTAPGSDEGPLPKLDQENWGEEKDM
jgi:hypothetical protein